MVNLIHSYLQVKHLRSKYKGLDIEVDGGVGISTIDAAAQVHVPNDTFSDYFLMKLVLCRWASETLSNTCTL